MFEVPLYSSPRNIQIGMIAYYTSVVHAFNNQNEIYFTDRGLAVTDRSGLLLLLVDIQETSSNMMGWEGLSPI